MALKPRIEALLERIKMLVAEEANKAKNHKDFVEKTALRILELVEDERKYGK